MTGVQTCALPISNPAGHVSDVHRRSQAQQRFLGFLDGLCAPDAANISRDYPVNVRVTAAESGLRLDTVLLCFQVRSLDSSRLMTPEVGALPARRMAEVDTALRHALWTCDKKLSETLGSNPRSTPNRLGAEIRAGRERAA